MSFSDARRVTVTKLPYHPLAEIFPLIEGVAFRDLVEDIRVHGLREPIIILNGMILDGRNRARACEAAQVAARYVTYDGRDPLAFVVSANLHRRHLDVSQRALIAARISEKVTPRRAGPSTKVGAKVAQRDRSERYKPAPLREKPSGEEAAKLMNISGASVTYARAVIERGTDKLIEAVERGNVSVHAASVVARFDPAEQVSILAAGPKAVTVLAREESAARAGKRMARSEVAVSPWDSFRVGDGRAIGNVEYDEAENMSNSLRICADVLDQIRAHVANGARRRIRDIITEKTLTDFISAARVRVCRQKDSGVAI